MIAELLKPQAESDYDRWRKLVQSELKEVPLEKRMFTPTYEGITLQPIYRSEDIADLAHMNSLPGFAPFVRGSNASGKPWEISQEISFPSTSEFNHAARNSLGRGLNALNIVLDRATRAGHDPDWAEQNEVGVGGLSIACIRDLENAFVGIDLEKISLFIRCGASALPFAALLVALARKRNKRAADLHGCIEMDPLGVLSHEGRLPQSLEGAYREMLALTRWANEHAPKLQTICVHSRSWHESGGHAVEELAFTLATGVEYLRRMHEQGLEVNEVAPKIRFAVTVGTNFFMEIAKLRALRMLWSTAVGPLGGDEDAQRLSLHVRSSQWNKTVNDPHNNILRATVEAIAGIVGGCNSMQIGAFDEVVRPADDISQRIARNTQLILQKECNLDRVIDPAGGCWLVESLTAQLAANAWKLFQEVEKLGGMEAALRVGFPQKTVAATAAEKLKNVAKRRDSIIGVNQYANAAEQPLETRSVDAPAFHKRRIQEIGSYRTSLDDIQDQIVLDKLAEIVGCEGPELFDSCVAAAGSGATLGEITRAIRIHDGPPAPITPVCITRAAVPFEHLRHAMNRCVAEHGKRPSAFLCNIGSLKDYKARADFSTGFFAAGGYDVISSKGFVLINEAVDALADSGAAIVVICSTDEKYKSVVPDLARTIRAKLPGTLIVLAGFPQDQIETYKSAGVDEFIHIRADAVELLTRIHKGLEIL